ncbi:PRC-barrel domain-containing protein [Sporomusa aerivorans]|uniref:PRC-barrel domain-containing protein n=1 Tax=Sporomusa aerivorans TaxID=204936 RepID=UPI00352A2389
MKKLRDLFGLPVLITGTGAQIGEVQEVIVDLEQAAVRGIMLAGANWFANSQGIVFEDVFRVGRDAIMLRAEYALRELTPAMMQGTVHYLGTLMDKQIYTDTGLSLGILMDALYDDITGEIKAYEVSDGLITDLLYGRKIMPLPQAQVVGQDKLIVPDTMTNLLIPESKKV